MGLRSRLKHRVRTLLGRPAPGPTAPTAGPPPPSRTAPPGPASPAAAASPPAPPPREAASTPPAATKSAAAPAPAAAPPAVPADKAAWHFERTRRAVLKFIEDHDDVSDLAAMHDYSERRYFIGHKRFSDLMETLLDDRFIDYDHATGVARLTERGRTHAHLPMPPKPKPPPAAPAEGAPPGA